MGSEKSSGLGRAARRSISALAALACLAVCGPAAAVQASASSRPPNTAIGGGFATISVGQVTVKGKSAHVPLRCSGTRHATCFVLVAMTIRRHGKPAAVGGTTVSLGVGRSATIRLPLYANGKRLLAAHHWLPVKITVETSKFKRIAMARVIFRR